MTRGSDVNKPEFCVAELGFYPFEDVRWAFDEIWSAIISRAQWLPARLEWTENPQELWLSDDLALSQTCGWPLITRLADKVRVVGAFRHTTPESAGHHYRSVILGRTDGTPYVNELFISPIRDANGKIVQFLGVQHRRRDLAS